MRKLMVLAAMLAMALVAASPAMANTSGIAGDVDGGFGNNGFGNNGFGNNGFGNNGFDDDFVFVDASQEQFALQVSAGDAFATGDESVAFSSVDQSVDQSQFNAGFDGDSDDDGISDGFDSVILAGDFDNNGIEDVFEF